MAGPNPAGSTGWDEEGGSMRPARRPRNWAGLLLVLLLGAGVALLALRWGAGRRADFAPGLPWHTDAAAAEAEARARGLPVLMVFSQPGCGYCTVLKEDVLDEAAFEDLVRERAVLADLDITSDPGTMERFRRYGFRGTPALVLARPDARAVAVKEGGRDVPAWLADALRTWQAGRPESPAAVPPPAGGEAPSDGPTTRPEKNLPA